MRRTPLRRTDELRRDDVAGTRREERQGECAERSGEADERAHDAGFCAVRRGLAVRQIFEQTAVARGATRRDREHRHLPAHSRTVHDCALL